MRLHNNPDLFKQAIRATAEEKGLLDIYIEKDYWITLALKLIFEQETGAYTVFKGGTALSKCEGMIERFSEDIDLVILQGEGESGAQKAKKIRAISKAVEGAMPEEVLEGVTSKTGMIRKTAHSYPKAFEGIFGQVRDKIIIEATWFGHAEPYSKRMISSYIYEMMVKSGQEKLAKEYDMLPFELKVLEPKRTFCEKIMSLVRFSYSDDPIVELGRKIRHIYDLYQMLENPGIEAFFESPEFESLLINVAEEDAASFKNNNGWLEHHPIESVAFGELERIDQELKGTYEGNFSGLVYGELPAWDRVVESMRQIRGRLSNVEWKIDLE